MLTFVFWLTTTFPYLTTEMFQHTIQITELSVWIMVRQTTLFTIHLWFSWYFPTVTKKVMTKMTNMVPALMVLFLLTDIHNV